MSRSASPLLQSIEEENGAARSPGADEQFHERPAVETGECQICSSPTGPRSPVYHRHYSSLYLRQMTGAEESPSSPHFCPSCIRAHVPYPEKRIKLVISDSTMHHFFAPAGQTAANRYNGDQIHIDYITIERADIRTLLHAFRHDYIDRPAKKALDVVLIAGYFDMLAGHSRDYIIEKIQEFSDTVKLAGEDSELNTFVTATLMYPPCLAWFGDNGPYPASGYINQRSKIDWLNDEIHRLNSENLAPNYPGLHTYGVRKSTRRRVNRYGQVSLINVRQHRWEHWIGADKQQMLHLKIERVFKIGSAINNYFRFNTEV